MSTLVCFTVDGDRYEVAIEDAQEIADIGVLAALPGALAGIAGLSMWHGQIITVLNLAERRHRPTAAHPRMLVLGDDGRRRAAVRIDTAQVSDLPAGGRGAMQRPFTRGRTLRDGRACWLIDTDAVLGASSDDGVATPWPLDVLLAQRGPDHVAIPMANVESVRAGAQIIVRHGDRRVPVSCDRLLGERTVTVMPLRPGLAVGHLGAVIVDEDRVALVLDPAELSS